MLSFCHNVSDINTIDQNIYIFFLGNNSALSAAEALRKLKSLEIGFSIKDANNQILAIETKNMLPENLLKQLGGTDRIGKVILEKEGIGPAEIVTALSPVPDNKFVLGLSSDHLKNKKLEGLAKEVKKKVKQNGGKMAFVLPKGSATRLNAAQVIFNKLKEGNNLELTVLNNYLVRTVQVQDIQAYEERDTGRAVRDAKVGMLPPKLAQIMINLALPTTTYSLPPKIYDPFCGLGTVLQEAKLMGFAAVGSDINPEMIQASAENVPETEIFLHDATTKSPVENAAAVVTEVFLGPPLSARLSPAEAERQLLDLAPMYQAFLKNVKYSLTRSGIAVIAFPAYKTKKGWKMLPESFLDQLKELGYSKQHLIPSEIYEFYEDSGRGTVIYARPDALVAREIFRLKLN